MEKEILEKYIRAGYIAAEVLNYAKRTVKNEMLVVDLAERIEKKVF